MNNGISAILLMLGLGIGNFIWQAFSGTPAWPVAVERTYFQTVAIGMAWLTFR